MDNTLLIQKQNKKKNCESQSLESCETRLTSLSLASCMTAKLIMEAERKAHLTMPCDESGNSPNLKSRGGHPSFNYCFKRRYAKSWVFAEIDAHCPRVCRQRIVNLRRAPLLLAYGDTAICSPRTGESGVSGVSLRGGRPLPPQGRVTRG